MQNHQDLQKYSIQNVDGFSEYKGLKIFGSSEEHEIIFTEFMKLNPSKDASILVLGAGTGAFDQRLLDSGFTRITSTDFLNDGVMVAVRRIDAIFSGKKNMSLGRKRLRSQRQEDL